MYYSSMLMKCFLFILTITMFLPLYLFTSWSYFKAHGDELLVAPLGRGSADVVLKNHKQTFGNLVNILLEQRKGELQHPHQTP